MFSLMDMLKGYCSNTFFRRSSLHLLPSNFNSRLCKLNQPATRLGVPLQISSSAVVKDRTSIEDVRSLRFITAVKTPYLPRGKIDLEAYDNLVNIQIENGVEGILVAGSTGEGQLMTWGEQIMLIAHTVNCFGDRVKVIGNAGSNCTKEAIKATERGFAVGMDAALHINPYYGKTSMKGLAAHYNNLLPIGPVIVYNVPSRSSQDIPPSVVEMLAQNPNFVGVKESVGNERVKMYTDKGIVVWGVDRLSHEARWDCGAVGVQSVASNLIPGLMRELMFEGKNPLLNSKLMPLFNWLFIEPSPIALSTALAQLGVIKPVFRLPYVPLNMEQRVEFVNLVKEMGRENFVGVKDVQVLDDDDFIIVCQY